MCKPAPWVHRMAETLLPYSVPSRRPAAKTKTELAREEKKRQEAGESVEEEEEKEEKSVQKAPLAGRGRLLELWSQPGQKRRGWTMVECNAVEN